MQIVHILPLWQYLVETHIPMLSKIISQALEMKKSIGRNHKNTHLPQLSDEVACLLESTACDTNTYEPDNRNYGADLNQIITELISKSYQVSQEIPIIYWKSQSDLR